MARDWEQLALEGLAFFGRISASVSHELKNVMAVINENAGLVEDLALMADRGAPLDPERLKKAAKSVQTQIQRGNTILKNMNAFAHSVDEPVRQTRLDETVQLMLDLSRRFAGNKAVTLAVGQLEPVQVKLNPFLLENLFNLCLTFALDGVGASKSLEVSVRGAATGPEIVFSGIEAPDAAFPSATVLAVAEAAGAALSQTPGRLTLTLSATPAAAS